MATSTGKTIALVLLLAIIFLFVWRVTPVLLAPFGVVTGVARSIHIPDMDDLYIGPHIFRYSSFSFLSFVLLIIWIFVIVWVYRDAERRGMNGVLWALLVFIGNLIGLLIYLIVRSDSLPSQAIEPRSKTCPSCQKSVAADFAFCPHCGARMEGVCPSCGKKVEEEWKVCPHCGEKIKTK
jgi:hypothetical protein